MAGSSQGCGSLARRSVHIPAPRIELPSVGVVVVTADRPNLVRRALASIAAQDYRGALRVVVVYDGATPDWRLTRGGDRPVLVLENWRTRGRAGARNTGILAAGDCDLVAICDDDDVWSPGKLTAQVGALRRSPGTVLSTCGLEVEYDGTRSARLLGRESVRAVELTGTSRCLRGSSFVAVQGAIAADRTRGGVGLFAETAPDEGVELDLLVRAARRAPIAHVDQPLIRVLWRPVDLGPAACAERAAGLRWVLRRHADLAAVPSVLARIAAEIACWSAAAGDRTGSRRWARAAMGARWWRPYGFLAAATATGLVRGRALRYLLRRTLRTH